MSSIKRFEDILAWKKARQLVKEIYLTCSTGEFYKDFDQKIKSVVLPVVHDQCG